MSAPRITNYAAWMGSRLYTHRRDGKPWYITGVVLTWHSHVEVYAHGFDGKDPHTRWSIIREGREYRRVENRLRTTRGIATVARRFAAEVFGGVHE